MWSSPSPRTLIAGLLKLIARRPRRGRLGRRSSRRLRRGLREPQNGHGQGLSPSGAAGAVLDSSAPAAGGSGEPRPSCHMAERQRRTVGSSSTQAGGAAASSRGRCGLGLGGRLGPPDRGRGRRGLGSGASTMPSFSQSSRSSSRLRWSGPCRGDGRGLQRSRRRLETKLRPGARSRRKGRITLCILYSKIVSEL